MNLEKQHVDLYDRQIRIWGLETQVKLGNSSIIIIGATEIASELCKNLILSGINRVAIVDDGIVSEQEAEDSLFINPANVSERKVTAIAKKFRSLNPYVQIDEIIASPASLSESHLKEFRYACVCIQDPVLIERLNSMCRLTETKFWAIGALGFFGYIFTDAGEYKYCSSGDDPGVPSKKLNLISYPSFSELLNLSKASFEHLKGISSKRARRSINPNLLTILVLWSILKQHDPIERTLMKLFKGEPHDDILDLFERKLQELDIDSSICSVVNLRTILSQWEEEIPFVWSIIGGYAVQDIITVISTSSEPINNLFFFDSFDLSGRITRVPPS